MRFWPTSNGKSAEALASVRESLNLTETLTAEDPKDEQKQIDRQQGLMREIEFLNADHLTERARAETKRALLIMKPLADSSSPFQHAEDYAQLFATTPFAELRDDAAALQYGRKAVAMTHEADPEVLHVLALAYERKGDKAHAREADNKALALLPPGATSVFRNTLAADENVFRNKIPDRPIAASKRLAGSGVTYASSSMPPKLASPGPSKILFRTPRIAVGGKEN